MFKGGENLYMYTCVCVRLVVISLTYTTGCTNMLSYFELLRFF